jgi:uncharacterized membrane-anchored protein YhcB (DUF1043 family)
MIGDYVLFWALQLMVLILGIAVGHSVLLLKIRREQNKSKALELALLEKRKEILTQGRKVATDLEEVLYQAKIQQEIDNITRNDRPNQ